MTVLFSCAESILKNGSLNNFSLLYSAIAYKIAVIISSTEELSLALAHLFCTAITFKNIFEGETETVGIEFAVKQHQQFSW